MLEFLVMAGRSLPHAILMMIPEPWQNHEAMSPRTARVLRIPLVADGAVGRPRLDRVHRRHGHRRGLDRNGLRPSRYYVTNDDFVVMASEVGVLDIPPENVVVKERLHPGTIFLVDTAKGRIVDDEEIKTELALAQPVRGVARART